MIVAQDPLRSNKWYGECFDAVISSPFGLQDLGHRQRANGGKMMSLLVGRLVSSGYGVYLTDANKFFIHDHKIIRREIEIVKPAVIVCLGKRAERICRKMGLPNILALPHLSGTARGAIVRKFPRLERAGATAENIAEEYAEEIVKVIQ